MPMAASLHTQKIHASHAVIVNSMDHLPDASVRIACDNDEVTVFSRDPAELRKVGMEFMQAANNLERTQ